VSNPIMQLALREWGQHLLTPTRVVIFVAISTVLTLAAPFDTGDRLLILPRFCYWSLLVWLGYSIGYFGDIVARKWLGPNGHIIAKTTVAGGLTGIGVFALVLILHRGFFAEWPDARLTLLIAANVFAISIIVSGVLQFTQQTTPQTQPTNATPRLLSRIPVHKHGALIAISVEDHYVRIITTKGEEMVLMRLSDAIGETAPSAGLQVHRSHWVAIDHVTAVERVKDRATLTLSSGHIIPVSRANVAQIKKAGLL
jgi:hypothetical protein